VIRFDGDDNSKSGLLQLEEKNNKEKTTAAIPQVHTAETLRTIIRHDEDGNYDECLTIQSNRLDNRTTDKASLKPIRWRRDNGDHNIVKTSGRHEDHQNFGVTWKRRP
jgi:hypothetical protein